ncbi:MAG: pyruvoyl-dependent arginine decarboxylase [Acidimicrobiales bacterium]|nr:pyruvoyl-dependent arginine decarboxylase [Acidimicrobiales bacterium]
MTTFSTAHLRGSTEPRAVRRDSAAESAGLTISVTSAVGTGPTPVVAFDAALLEAGVGNLNLVRLSSVVPTGATIEVAAEQPPAGGPRDAGWGDRHYVVYADARAATPGEVAAACVGWVQDPATGSGLFVEIEGDDEARVRREVAESLEVMADARNLDLGAPVLLSRSIRCDHDPVCALVVASFATESWT